MSSPRRLKSPVGNETSEPASASCPPTPRALSPWLPPWLPPQLPPQHLGYSQAVSSSPDSSTAVGRRTCCSICCQIPATFSCQLLPGGQWEAGSAQGPPRIPGLGAAVGEHLHSSLKDNGGHTCECCREAVDLTRGWRGSLVTPRLIHKVGLDGQQSPARAMQSLAVAVPGV